MGTGATELSESTTCTASARSCPVPTTLPTLLRLIEVDAARTHDDDADPHVCTLIAELGDKAGPEQLARDQERRDVASLLDALPYPDQGPDRRVHRGDEIRLRD